jgi:hypothetical protein
MREHEGQIRSRRRMIWHWVDDFEFTFRGLLPPEEAAVVLQALRAAMNDLEHPHDGHDHDRDESVCAETSSAKALATLKETIPLLTFPVSHPAYPERCHIENGPAISPAMLQMIACSATISTMLLGP